MKASVQNILIGFIVIVPFAILEGLNTAWYSRSGFPTTLFLGMWINSSLLAASVHFTYAKLQEGIKGANVISFVAVLIATIILSSAFVTILIDQMSCFLGGRGC